MKWYRVFFLMSFLAVAVSCSNPVVPNPQEPEEPTKDDENPPKGGFVLDGIDNLILGGADIFFA